MTSIKERATGSFQRKHGERVCLRTYYIHTHTDREREGMSTYIDRNTHTEREREGMSTHTEGISTYILHTHTHTHIHTHTQGE